MKTIAIIILVIFTSISTFSQTLTNGIYFLDGKTTEVERKVYSIIPTNKSDLVYFSDGLIAKINLGADFSINSFFQEILNTSISPQKARFGQSSLSTTFLKGTALFSQVGSTNVNSSCVVSTPMIDVELSGGLFYFEITENKSIVACLDGTMKSHIEKKEIELIGSEIIIVESNFARPDEKNLLDDKIKISRGKINTGAMKRLTEEAKDILKLRNSTMFIRINGKTIGVDISEKM